MKYLSLRTQVVSLVLIFLVSSVLFFRFFFLESFITYQNTLNHEKTKEEIVELYQNFEKKLPLKDSPSFKIAIEKIISDEKQRAIAGNIFQQKIALYSVFVFAFLLLFGMLFIAFSFYLITRPLQRLEAATQLLASKNLDVSIAENRFSPINPLIISFNAMVEELRENREKLLEAEKEIIWRETARVTAHEIKNPLTPIQLSLERMQNKLGSEEFPTIFQNAITIIFDEIKNLRNLAAEFSEFARFPQAKMESFNLTQLITEIVEPYQEKTHIALKFSGNLHRFFGDAIQIKQALTNLIQNAIQADATGIIISAQTKNQQFMIQIEDDGKGIAQTDLPKLFEPYFSKHKRGTGLGLAIVKRIVENHNGNIAVKSTFGKGTVFKIEI